MSSSATPDSKHVSTRRRKRRPKVVAEDDVNGVSDEKENREKTSEPNRTTSSTSRKLLSGFQNAVQSINNNDELRNYWKQEEALAKIVVKASLALASDDNRKKGIDGLILLNGKVSELMNMSRKLVKEAMVEPKEESKNNSKMVLSCLLVAVHILRAVGPLLSDDVQREKAIKILYHCLSRCEKLLIDNTIRSDKMVTFLGLVTGAFAAMGQILQAMTAVGSSSGGEDKNSSKFQVSFEEGSIMQDDGECLFVADFVHPQTTTKQRKRSTLTSNNPIAFQELSSIYVHTSISVARILGTLSTRELDDTVLSTAAQFWGRKKSQQQQQQQWGPQLRNEASVLLTNVASHWTETIGQFATTATNTASKNGSESTLAKYGRQAHRILWEAAARCDHQTVECLQLRKAAISLLLGFLIPSCSNNNDIVDSACTYAWKAALAFASAVSTPTISSENEQLLCSFHVDVTAALKKQSAILPDSLAVVEYLVFRALHTAAVTTAPDEASAQPLKEELNGWIPVFRNFMIKAVMGLTLMKRNNRAIRGDNDDDKSTVDCASTQFLESLKMSVKEIDATVVPFVSAQCRDAATLKRVFKLLSMLRFHKEVHAWLRMDGGSRSEGILRTVGLILIDGIGKIAHHACCNRSLDGPTASRIWEFTVECYIQAIAVNEEEAALKRAVPHDDSCSGDSSDIIVWNLVQNLEKNGIKRKCQVDGVHSIAKALLYFSKRRVSGSTETTDPSQLILASIHLCDVLHRTHGVVYCKVQLDSQWSLLASAYRSAGATQHSIVAATFALLYSVLESAEAQPHSSSDDALVDLLCSIGSTPLLWLTSSNTASFKRSARVREKVARFVSLTCDNSYTAPGKTSQGKALTLKAAIAGLRCCRNEMQSEGSLQSFIEVQTGTAFSIAGLLRSVVYKHLRVEQSVSRSSSLALGAFAMVEVVSRMTATCQRRGMSSHDDQSTCVETEIAELAVKLLPETGKTRRRMFGAIIRFSSSFSAIACHPVLKDRIKSLSPFPASTSLSLKDDVTLTLAFDRSQEAVSALLQMSRETDDAEFVAFSIALLPQLALQGNAISEAVKGEQKADSIVDRDEFLATLQSFDIRALKEGSRKKLVSDWFVASMAQLSDHFLLAGCWMSAAESSRLGFNVDPLACFSMRLSFALSQGCCLSAYSQPETSPIENVAVDLEWKLSECHFTNLKTLFDVDEKNATEPLIIKYNRAIEQYLVSYGLSKSDAPFLPLFQWVKSTAKFVRAESKLMLGNAEAAMTDLVDCLIECRRLENKILRCSRDLTAEVKTTEMIVAQSSLATRCHDRQIACLTKLANLHSLTGDLRKAHSYALSALELVSDDSDASGLSFRDFVAKETNYTTPRQKQIKRLCLSILARGTPGIVATHRDACDVSSSEARVSTGGAYLGFEFQLEHILDSLTLSPYSEEVNNTATLAEDASRAYSLAIRQPRVQRALKRAGLDEYGDGISFTAFGQFCLLEMKTRIQSLSDETVQAEANRTEIDSLVHNVSVCAGTPSDILAEAYYLGGYFYLRVAQISGVIQKLWTGHSNSIETETAKLGEADLSVLSKAKMFLDSAVQLKRHHTDDLSRNIIRSLALVSGPESNKNSSRSQFLVHASVSRAWRSRMASSVCGDKGNLAYELFDPVCDKESISKLYEEIFELTPLQWRFVTAVLCPSGEMLLTAVEKGRSSTSCVFPANRLKSVKEEVLQPICNTIGKNQKQLTSRSEAATCEREETKEKKREWWNERKALDSELEDRIEELETAICGPGNTKTRHVLLGDCKESVCGRLSSKFDSLVDNEKEEEALESCTFLILDETLNKIPFEGMKSFQGRTVCRLPCISYALHRLSTLGFPTISDERISFVLDPEENLKGTRDRLLPVIRTLSRDRWQGVVGSEPPKEFFESALLEDRNILLYFGHGGAEKYYSGKELRELAKSRTPVKAGLVLMGCSSGRLLPIGDKTGYENNQERFYEPEGIAYSYLASGAPFVVGNLWDVTDQDIDRFSVTFLADFLDKGRGSSVAWSLENARDACKMRYIVGCAPVCYGFPAALAAEAANTASK